MAERGTLRVQPEVMHSASQALSAAAKDLHTRLIELDGQVRELLARWRGGSGDAYGEAWDLWHRGTGEVQLGLSTLAKVVGVAGAEFQGHDQTATQALDGVYRG
ncbi:pore-forming CpnT exporter EsxF [Mycobacterium cookii]|uniref:ESAT-6-like protein n=1 Tax=Mycobacterium cookii TaxID=1775 RepID=A0A7I7L1T9_9MYCO|nr:WXG100 family type VII secretion target [Mycobacterium cookii]MCV7329796.1 WXG100 family type VII secretion target [Mycobacterium cookii]BBX47936.1 ESAT-6-like protein EsxF [Mycobacterium cookii]